MFFNAGNNFMPPLRQISFHFPQVGDKPSPFGGIGFKLDFSFMEKRSPRVIAGLTRNPSPRLRGIRVLCLLSQAMAWTATDVFVRLLLTSRLICKNHFRPKNEGVLRDIVYCSEGKNKTKSNVCYHSFMMAHPTFKQMSHFFFSSAHR
jgi:hypothetical protein